MGRHLLMVAGSEVVIQNGKVISVTEPKTNHCPLRAKLYGIDGETTETVRRSVEFYIKEWGMFTPDRVVTTSRRPVTFGVSEIFSSGLRQGLLDAVVSVCEGAGTTISADPNVVEAIGAHMTWLKETSPEPAILRRLEEVGATILSPEKADIDQFKGVLQALHMGFERIGVTATGHRMEEIQRIRESFRGKSCAIAAVHNTGIDRQAAEEILSGCDLVSSCASRWVREIVGRRAIMQIGVRMPTFVLTSLGRQLALARLSEIEDPLVVGTGVLPLINEHQPTPLR